MHAEVNRALALTHVTRFQVEVGSGRADLPGWGFALRDRTLVPALSWKVAMRQFRRRGRGVLVQNGSIVGRTAKPDFDRLRD